MPEPKTAPYGSWSSPITSDMIVASSIGLGDILLDGGDVYWLEARPQEGGRSVVVRRAADGTIADVTPPLPPAGSMPAFNVRSRVHEYGGGAYLVDAGIVYFSNDGDQRLYRQRPGAAPEPITPDPGRARGLRYADGVIDGRRRRLIAVREDHTTAAAQPVNAIVAIPLDGDAAPRLLLSGRDFYAAPRPSPDGSRLAWLEWDHPLMPWLGCELWVGELAGDGSIGVARRVAGGNDESIFQPEWSPDGVLYFVSDRAQPDLAGRWWNLFRAPRLLEGDAAIEPVLPLIAEFGRPQWSFRMSTYAFDGTERLVCSYIEDGIHRLGMVDLASLETTALPLPYQDISSVRAANGQVYFRGGAPASPPAIVAFDLAQRRATTLKLSTTQDVEAYRGYISPPEPVAFDTDDGLKAYGLFYPPRNIDYMAPDGELPPLLVHCHGGPTGAASATLSWGTQYWTSRGFAVLDVNYGGRTGYGREFRLRLQGKWGIVDVADCANGARYLAETRHAVDRERWAISGGSAGGFTTLAVLTFRKEFKTGASYYGVSDLEALAKDTHKFESRYLDGLIGPYPERRDLYLARSPVHSARLLSVPVAFFQGAEDRVVPPEQAEIMVAALRRRGIPCLYLLFDGEQHGFRRADNIKRALDAELYFYAAFLTDAPLEFRAPS
jgi:dipeptidyl aminopeptidase/acylaminoacyl peptidase